LGPLSVNKRNAILVRLGEKEILYEVFQKVSTEILELESKKRGAQSENGKNPKRSKK
jgi:hypothetical protein